MLSLTLYRIETHFARKRAAAGQLAHIRQMILALSKTLLFAVPDMARLGSADSAFAHSALGAALDCYVTEAFNIAQSSREFRAYCKAHIARDLEAALLTFEHGVRGSEKRFAEAQAAFARAVGAAREAEKRVVARRRKLEKFSQRMIVAGEARAEGRPLPAKDVATLSRYSAKESSRAHEAEEALQLLASARDTFGDQAQQILAFLDELELGRITRIREALLRFSSAQAELARRILASENAATESLRGNDTQSETLLRDFLDTSLDRGAAPDDANSEDEVSVHDDISERLSKPMRELLRDADVAPLQALPEPCLELLVSLGLRECTPRTPPPPSASKAPTPLDTPVGGIGASE